MLALEARVAGLRGRCAMRSDIRAHIRSNLVGYLALFCFAMAGTASATHLGGANTISTEDIINGQVRTADVQGLTSSDIRDASLPGGGLAGVDLRLGSVGSDQLADNAIPADGISSENASTKVANGSIGWSELAGDSVDFSKVIDGSLTGDDLQDTTRSVQLPLSAFLNCSSDGPIDFNSGADSAPDFFASGPLLLYWDGDDVQRACTSLVVPQDYVSGGQLVLITWPDLVSHDNDWTGFTSRQVLGAPRDLTMHATSGGTNCDAGVPRHEIYLCVLTITGPISAGDGLTVHVARDGGSDPFMYLSALEFRYTAQQ